MYNQKFFLIHTEQKKECLLDVVVAKDLRRDGGGKTAIKVRTCNLVQLLLCELLVLDLRYVLCLLVRSFDQFRLRKLANALQIRVGSLIRIQRSIDCTVYSHGYLARSKSMDCTYCILTVQYII